MTTRAFCLVLGLAVAPAAMAQPVSPEPDNPLRFELDGSRSGLSAFQMVVVGGESRSYLGIAVIEIDDERAKDLKLNRARGVEVTNVVLNAPADKAGIDAGDVVLTFAGEPVRGVEHLARLVRETPVGRDIPLEIWRQGKAETLMARIGERNVNPLDDAARCEAGEDCGEFRISRGDLDVARIQVPRPRIVMRSRTLGAETEEIEGQFASFFGVEKGVLVRTVDSASAAEQAGLQAGDVIVTVDKRQVATPMDVIQALRISGGKDRIALGIVRHRRKLTLSLALTASAGKPLKRPMGPMPFTRDVSRY